MTDQTPPPPPPPANYGDAKAQAKAAQAYAKAQRPWYKKKRWIGLIAIVVIAIAAGAGSGGGDDDKGSQVADAPVTNSQSGDGDKPAEEKPAGPDNSSKGKGAITWGNWQVEGRLQVSKEDFSGDFAVVTRVRNTGDEADTGIFTVTILKGSEILGTADCTTPEIDPGAIGTANCFSTDDFKAGYTEVTIEDSF